MKCHPHYRGGNRLLDTIPDDERDRILHHAQDADLLQDETIGCTGEPIRHVYFPVDCIVSLMAQIKRQDVLSTALIGQEGIVGSSSVVGIEVWPQRINVEHSGRALCIGLVDFRHCLEKSPVLKHKVRRFAGTLYAQAVQSASCAVMHTVEARLASWLLEMDDRIDEEELVLHHAAMARVLGVSLGRIRQAVHGLSGQMLIRDQDGHVSMVSREGLEERACGCRHRFIAGEGSLQQGPHRAAPIAI